LGGPVFEAGKKKPFHWCGTGLKRGGGYKECAGGLRRNKKISEEGGGRGRQRNLCFIKDLGGK